MKKMSDTWCPRASPDNSIGNSPTHTLRNAFGVAECTLRYCWAFGRIQITTIRFDVNDQGDSRIDHSQNNSMSSVYLFVHWILYNFSLEKAHQTRWLNAAPKTLSIGRSRSISRSAVNAHFLKANANDTHCLSAWFLIIIIDFQKLFCNLCLTVCNSVSQESTKRYFQLQVHIFLESIGSSSRFTTKNCQWIRERCAPEVKNSDD